MKMIRIILLSSAAAFAGPTVAGDLTLDAAIGGAVGGAVGGAIGAELGGRNGAIAGAGLGAAAGVTINTNDSDRRTYRSSQDHLSSREYYIPNYSHSSRFCPPGQAKKGRC
jgi:uncharacterized protein YcfJ